MSDGAVANGLSGFLSREGNAYLRKTEPIVALYDELRPSLFGYLICLGLTPQESEDVIQDTFVQFFRVLQGGGEVTNPRSWLFRVARNLSLNLQKRERRLVSDSDHGPQAGSAIAGMAPDPEEAYVRKERMRLLAATIAQLPQRQQECLHLRAEGLRYREIAEVVGTTTSAVSESLKRAVGRLLEEFYD